MENQKVSFKKVATITLYAYITVLVLSIITYVIVVIPYSNYVENKAIKVQSEIEKIDSIAAYEITSGEVEAAAMDEMKRTSEAAKAAAMEELKKAMEESKKGE